MSGSLCPVQPPDRPDLRFIRQPLRSKSESLPDSAPYALCLRRPLGIYVRLNSRHPLCPSVFSGPCLPVGRETPPSRLRLRPRLETSPRLNPVRPPPPYRHLCPTQLPTSSLRTPVLSGIRLPVGRPKDPSFSSSIPGSAGHFTPYAICLRRPLGARYPCPTRPRSLSRGSTTRSHRKL